MPYVATVSGASGFSGTVDMSVTGLPGGATASFAPGQVVGSGSTTLTVATSSSTPAGTYQLTIRGTSGTLTRTTGVTLVVNADFSLLVTPSSRTISRGGKTTYNVAATTGGGVSGGIKFSVSGLPKTATGKFNPASLSGSGTSVLTVSTGKNVARGSYPLTITGTSAGAVRTTSATLVIQ